MAVGRQRSLIVRRNNCFDTRLSRDCITGKNELHLNQAIERDCRSLEGCESHLWIPRLACFAFRVNPD